MPNQRILLLEDDAQTSPLLTHVLIDEGYVIDFAETMEKAWALLHVHHYGLVIADWRLPDGNGLEIANAAARAGSKTIIMSGYLFQMPVGAADAHDIMMKPVRPTEIIAAVKRHIGDPATAA